MINIHILAYAALGSGLSGGDRIFIEFARRWSQKYPVTVYVWKEGLLMCQRQHLSVPVQFNVLNLGIWEKLGFLICYLARIIGGISTSCTMILTNHPSTIVYSASEFWMDSLPAVILKIRYPQITWVAAWYQTAPNPLIGYSSGRYRFSALLYWLVQQPIKPLINTIANLTLVNNDSERVHFSKSKTLVVLGAVDLEAIVKYIKSHPKFVKIYDAVFQGRFHPQKGVIELIDIWSQVVKEIPTARLAMIGDGPLMAKIKLKISQLNLSSNIDLFGYIFDGDQKYQIFSQSLIVVHPAFYDSGGMASAEAMAFGLPCIGFDLEAYKSYYPKGMVKVPHGDLPKFTQQIILLLTNDRLRKQLGIQAKKMIESGWSWDIRAEQVLNSLIPIYEN